MRVNCQVLLPFSILSEIGVLDVAMPWSWYKHRCTDSPKMQIHPSISIDFLLSVILRFASYPSTMDQATAKGSQWPVTSDHFLRGQELVFSLSCGPSPLDQCSLGIISPFSTRQGRYKQNKLKVSTQDKHLVKVPEAVFCDEDWLSTNYAGSWHLPFLPTFCLKSWDPDWLMILFSCSRNLQVKLKFQCEAAFFSGFFSNDEVKATPISRQLIFWRH